ncbi:MAG: hypothetical protein V7608_2260 [Hyphomicrobiales bacterium]|jgi:hypothetical protein
MFATPFTAFHTILSLVAIVAGACVMMMLVKNRRPDVWTLTFLITMIATDVTGFIFPFTKLLPSHITAIISLVLLALVVLGQYVFKFAGAWRWIYAVTIGLAVYLNFFVLVTQLFLKVPALHALAPNAPDNPEPPFLIAQTVVLAIFIFLIWKSVKNFRGAGGTFKE